MRKAIIAGFALGVLLPGTLKASDGADEATGEKTYRCWRIEKDVDGNLDADASAPRYCGTVDAFACNDFDDDCDGSTRGEPHCGAPFI